MLIRRICSCLAAFLLAVGCTSAVWAQHEIHHIPPWIDADGFNPDLAHPFIEPLAFDPDWNFFAPAEVGEFGGGPELRTGWYGGYDRLHLWVTRPQNQFTVDPTGLTTNAINGLRDQTGGDYGWGNRYDVGYMTEEDHGWAISYWNLSGPNYSDVIEIERVDVFEPDDEINNDPTSTINLRGMGGGGGGGQQQMMNMMRNGIPPRDQNDPITGFRTFNATQTINVADISSFELNKTFRLKKLAYGSVIEPFFGFRYMNFRDMFRRDRYVRYDEDGNPLDFSIPSPNDPPMLGPITNFEIEDLIRNTREIQNHMVGGHFGFRWYKRKSRWQLSSDVRLFMFQNFQELEGILETERTFFDGVAVDADIDAILVNRVRDSDHANEFVFGGEIRAQAAFEITRDVSIRMGLTFIEFARGIGRGGTLQGPGADQDVTMIGGSLGFTVNR